ncbi:MAG TPA: chemotaxis protein CheW [Polyangia bacterium]|jgi:purine-binding chemotaxis protein CheW
MSGERPPAPSVAGLPAAGVPSVIATERTDPMGGGGARPRPAPAAVDVIQLVVFRVGAEEYALDILRIKEIINPLRVTLVPKAPRFIEGVVELRGTILPVVDLRKRFDLPPTPMTRRSKYVIVGTHGRVVGLIVDAVSETLRVPRADLKPPPAFVGEAVASDYFLGVCYLKGRILFLLNLETILTSQERIHLGGLAAERRDPGSR